MAALAPAYPPLSGEPATAAPLDRLTTTDPDGSGSRSASPMKLNAWRTSTSQLAQNDSHDCSDSGAAGGVAPALSTNVCGRYSATSRAATSGSAASAVTGLKRSPSWSANSASGCSLRATPTTWAPTPASTTAVARPKPRLAPVTTAVVPDKP